MDTKMEYEAPTLIEVGSFEEITKGSKTSGGLDVGHPAGTPDTDLTFS